MDTLTHIVLGACIGEALAGKSLGKKALLLGAIAQNIPDIDFIASFWLPTSADLLAHRAITHSFLFAVLVSPLLAWVSTLFSKDAFPFKKWLLFWGLQIFIHQFIDAFNAYGTGWFEPFSHYRVTFNSLFVADPLLSVWPGIALVILLVLKRASPKRKAIALTALALGTFYLILSLVFKTKIDKTVVSSLHAGKVAYYRYFTTPTPLNDLLWYVVAEDDSGFYVAYRSVFDRGTNVDFRYVYRNDSLLRPYSAREDLKQLIRFSRGYYTLEKRNDTVIFNDLCFGEILGWTERNPEFVFHYYLDYPADNKMIVQRGRFARWDNHAFRLFLERIIGK